MKAYKVRDRNGYSDYSVVVFAETPGRAKSLALDTDEFQRCDWDFTELTATREKKLDSAYRGRWYMDWANMDDRVVLVRDAGYYCDPDYVEMEDCKDCLAKEWCSQYERMLEEGDDF